MPSPASVSTGSLASTQGAYSSVKRALSKRPKKRRSNSAKKRKIRTVMREFKKGKLKSSSGQKVTNPKQALAISLSEARNA